MHAGHVDHVAGSHEAVAGVHHHRCGVHRLAFEQIDDGRRRQFGVLIGHVAALGHARPREGGVAQHMHKGHCRAFHAEPIHPHPAAVEVDKPCAARDVARALRWHDIEHIGTHVFKLEPCHAVGAVNFFQLGVGFVFDDAGVVVFEGFLEERLFGRDLRVGVEHQHFALGFVLLEVTRHHAGALIGPGWAAVGRLGNAERVNTTVAHGLQLLAQGHGLWPGFPTMQHVGLRGWGGQAADLFVHEVHARAHDKPVVGVLASTGRADFFSSGVDGRDLGLHHVHPHRTQATVTERDVGHFFMPAQHQV